MNQQKELLDLIYRWKPLCVWNIGGSSPVCDIYRNMVTELFMGCTDGYACSAAQVLVSYMQSDSEDVKESIRYAKECGQKLHTIRIVTPFERENMSLTRKELGIPENSFALCIVGNRLDGELSAEFIGMLDALLDMSDKYHIVLVGECRKSLLGRLDADRYTMLGFRKDLLDVIAMTDLFVNPPRQGGGGGAGRAFAVGVPVVTFSNCDVSNVTGPDFCCQNLSQMQEQITRYHEDREFYKKQQEKVWDSYRKKRKLLGNVANEIQQMLQQVELWLQTGEIQ
jgi:glycosyltransferase involved in cell wall biosynthesis